MHDAIIIGAGHNGLTCAYYLAKRGLKVAVLESATVVGGAAVTDEFLPGFRNSAASYTVSLLQPKVIRDMELERHGLKVVLRKTDNFLPGNGDYLLAGRGGLTRKEIARHVKADGEAYDRYVAELGTVVPLLKKWLLRAPPNVGSRVSAIPKLLSLGRDMAGLSLVETRIVHDFAVRSAGEVLDRHFKGDLVKALFGFDGVVGNFASPYSAGQRVRSAPPSVRRGRGRARRLGPCDRRHGLDHPGDGAGVPRGRRRHPLEHSGRRGDRRAQRQGARAVGVVAGGKAWRAANVVAGVNPKLLFDRLVPGGAVDPDVESRMRGWKCESATFRMNVALSELPKFTVLPKRGNHLTAGIIMAPSLDYMHRAWLDAEVSGWAREPIIEMLIPSTLDPTLAPKGRAGRLSVLPAFSL